jgi:acyl-CoA synthetase (AMP-forming)/AMP-acid ligase II
LLKAEQWVLHPQNPEFGNEETASQQPGVTPDAFPMTPSGKIQKFKLRESFTGDQPG